MININSKDNEKIKYAKSLLKGKHRKEEEKFLVEGLRIIKQSIECDCEIDYVLYTKEFEKKNEEFIAYLETLNIRLYSIDEKLVKEFSQTENTQGVFAIIKSKVFTLDDVFKEDNDFLLILDRIQDPGNMGTLIRSADASGVNGIIVLKGSVDVYNPKVIRSTMGSVFNSIIVEEDNSCLIKLKNEGYKIISSSLETDKYYHDINYTGKIALVIGNEGNGIDEYILDNSDEKVKIPIYGKAESLNAAIAGGILMYDIKNKLVKNKIV